MKIAIHKGKNDFSTRWINYCENNHIDFKLVDCYKPDIVKELSDCDALMWHHSQNNYKALLIAKPLLFTLQQTGKKVFPDFNTGWHFNDKLGQMFLLEAIEAPFVPCHVFFNKKDALEWIKNTDFPKVFKLRGGAGSSNVKLVKKVREARRLVRKAFGRGFKQYDAISSIKETTRKFFLRKAALIDLFKGLGMIVYSPRYSKFTNRERGYVYFQDFIPNLNHDIRIVVINDKAFAIKRLVRKNDFRASGSGFILYDKELINEELVRLSFKLADKIKGQSIAFDFVDEDNNPRLLEISYGFVPEGYDRCPGYWDRKIHWHEGPFDPYGWMVDNILRGV
jgi:glutathione synthase/RimK-type ligase-like ATP-grasp enzyme